MKKWLCKNENYNKMPFMANEVSRPSCNSYNYTIMEIASLYNYALYRSCLHCHLLEADQS